MHAYVKYNKMSDKHYIQIADTTVGGGRRSH